MLISIISIFVAIAATESSKEIAEKSGSFDKGNLVAHIGKVELNKNKTIEIIYGVDFEKYQGDITIGNIPLAITNKGNKSLFDVTITHRYHEMFKRDVFQNFDFISEGGYESKEIGKHFSKMGTEHISSFHLPRLDPGKNMLIADPIALEETRFSSDVELNNGLTIKTEMEFSLSFDISISARNLLGEKSIINMRVFDAKSKDDLLEKFIIKVVRVDQKELREKSNFFQYFGYLLFQKIEKRIILIYPKFIGVTAGGITIYNAEASTDVIRSVVYKRATYALLW